MKRNNNHLALVLPALAALALTHLSAHAQIQFSLDLGSDKEISDPFGGAGEGLDPGDVFVSSGVAGSTGAPWLDDAAIFGADPFPVQFLPATACPPGSNLFPRCFDLDGFDQLDVRISQVDLGTFISPDQLPSQCIDRAEFMSISTDDDGALGMPAPAGLRAPTEDLPNRGSAATSDEVFGVTRGGGAVVVAPIASETAVHVDLGPNPLPQVEDDDIDALDQGEDFCIDVVYFSADHEARLAATLNLNPGTIYEFVLGGAAPTPAVTFADLGTTPATDIDAFEFAWVRIPGAATPALALLFSVDENDPGTALDESGGLDPGAIYASFLNGFNFVYIPSAVLPPRDIDAIATANDDLTLGQDSDGDGIPDSQDNCILVANPAQVDADGDGIGNLCDPDFDGNCLVNFPDLLLFQPQLFGVNPIFDLNVDGIVNFGDLAIVASFFFGPPGPSAFACP